MYAYIVCTALSFVSYQSRLLTPLLWLVVLAKYSVREMLEMHRYFVFNFNECFTTFSVKVFSDRSVFPVLFQLLVGVYCLILGDRHSCSSSRTV
jgi:hypothetical protein